MRIGLNRRIYNDQSKKDRKNRVAGQEFRLKDKKIKSLVYFKCLDFSGFG